jgi:hypothetical protein
VVTSPRRRTSTAVRYSSQAPAAALAEPPSVSLPPLVRMSSPVTPRTSHWRTWPTRVMSESCHLISPLKTASKATLAELDVWGVVNCAGWEVRSQHPMGTNIDVFDKAMAQPAGTPLVIKYRISLDDLLGCRWCDRQRIHALELGPYNIRVNSVNPTVVMTACRPTPGARSHPTTIPRDDAPRPLGNGGRNRGTDCLPS